jgi:excisionase family DNA binding protein
MAETCIPVLEAKRPLTKQEVADWGGWTLRYIDMEIAKGRLVKTMSGKAVRLMAEDVRAWINNRKSK